MSGLVTERPAGARAVKASELEQLTFSPAGLVHWLVVDVAAGVASQNGQREESEWLRELPNPARRSSPPGSMAVLGRVRDETTALWVRTWNETSAIGHLDRSLVRNRPFWLDASMNSAMTANLWVGAAREAAHIARMAYETAVVRDRREELNGIPVDEEAGWLATWTLFVQLDLWGHAREETFWPLANNGVESEDMGLIVGGAERWWPEDAAEEPAA